MGSDRVKKIPLVVIKRLPRYYRYLGELLQSGAERISSGELAKLMSCTASQIRQDLNYFGGFGQQGYGYNVEQLYAAIGEILGLNVRFSMVVIGAGNLGRAILNYAGFERRGFHFVGVFDNNPELVGQQIQGNTVQHIDALEAFCREHHPDIAVLAIPKANAQEIAQRLDVLDIKGIWNFSHMDIQMSRNIPVENVHLSDSLMTLSYRIREE